MNIIFIILVVIIVIVFLVRIFEQQQSQENSHTSRKTYEPKAIDDIGNYFQLKPYFFSQSERSFFNILEQENRGRYIILSKVRLEDIVIADSRLNWKEKGIKRNFIKSKHIDFVLLTKDTGKIFAVIELDGWSHSDEKQKRYDRIKDLILHSVGVSFHRVRTGDNFSEKINMILNAN